MGGNLECDGAIIRVADGYAIDAEAIEVRSIFARGSVLDGGINLSGAKLVADFDCTDAEICADRWGRDLRPGDGKSRRIILKKARIDGETRFVAVQDRGDLDCTDAALNNPGGNALDMSRMEIKGAFFLRGDAKSNGALILTGASIGTIHDQRVLLAEER